MKNRIDNGNSIGYDSVASRKLPNALVLSKKQIIESMIAITISLMNYQGIMNSFIRCKKEVFVGNNNLRIRSYELYTSQLNSGYRKKSDDIMFLEGFDIEGNSFSKEDLSSLIRLTELDDLLRKRKMDIFQILETIYERSIGILEIVNSLKLPCNTEVFLDIVSILPTLFVYDIMELSKDQIESTSMILSRIEELRSVIMS